MKEETLPNGAIALENNTVNDNTLYEIPVKLNGNPPLEIKIEMYGVDLKDKDKVKDRIIEELHNLSELV